MNHPLRSQVDEFRVTENRIGKVSPDSPISSHRTIALGRQEHVGGGLSAGGAP